MADLSSGASAIFLSGTIGLDYFLSKSDFAPYLGGNFGFGATKVNASLFDSSLRGGFVIAPEVGFFLLRTSAINLDIGLKAEYLLNSNEFGKPAAYSLRVGILF